MSVQHIGLVLWTGATGGAEIFNVELAKSFSREGRRVTVFFVGSPEPLMERLDNEGVAWYALGLPRGRGILLAGRRLAREINVRGCDAVITVAGGYLALALRTWGFRGVLVAQDHGSLLNRSVYGRVGAFVKLAERVLDPYTLDAQVAVSAYMAGRVRRVPHARRLVVIPNGVDIALYAARDVPGRRSTIRLGIAARLVVGKGVERLIQAVRNLRDDGVDVTCDIAGSGPLENALRVECTDRGLDDAIAFRGRVKDMPAFWNSVDVCVAPSDGLVESFGLSVAEAMACGRPTIVSDKGGLAELVEEGVTGWLVLPGDAGALAERIRWYVSHPAMIAVHGAAARDRATKEWSLVRCASRYLELVDSLACEHCIESQSYT